MLYLLRSALCSPPITVTVIEPSDDIDSVTDILVRRIEEFELQNQLDTTPHWMSLFEEEPPGSLQSNGHLLRTSCHSPHTPSPRLHSRQPRSPRGLLSSDASLTSDSDSPCSISPRSHHAWPRDLPPSSSRFRPRTLSLDAKLSVLKAQRGYGGFQCSCQAPSACSVAQRPTQTALSCSSSTSSNSSSEGSTSPESDLGFSRPSGARRSLRNLRAKLDPRNWLQSQV